MHTHTHTHTHTIRGIVRNDSIWDYLVFGKVQKLLGGRLRFILTGSAPISEKVMDFLRIATGCQVREIVAMDTSHRGHLFNKQYFLSTCA